MKYSVAAVSALAATALAKPSFTNVSFQVEVGQPFTLTFAGCSSGCTIELQTGASNNLKDVKTLATGVTGTSATVTLDKIPSGTYNFKITDASGESNYSAQFPVQGDVAASASASSETSAKETNTATEAPTSTAASSSAEKSTTLVKSTTAHTTAASNSTTASPSSHSSTAKHNSTSAAITTGPATTTSAAETTAAKTSSKPAVTTVPPGSAAGRLSSPIALVAGVALAIAFLS
ncbi:uncharacterized protein TrAFT101_001600 [Trichoderma asperellum]|uniref:Yeast cell wall synthesis Kre9/Knh1-like N-terminal domain-containing protein n=1 Tax=Trichoderma asperellum (strain ATCC 204424 / CBS 433.97 / NBRC 101777) TaxID=1042311 RepID=A0A2T3ZE05_TRIA4|nr:hypothetical protein M441DRAFT_66799 [Trichoderma asperellum CBS 433.97]PTB43041.1 hypothetical protein M441DRAFT_66799 [Trichoderma asperellum CBS 433.97]UKZ85754.1 hypothetical protein TrAFT101_001600 [Trichoderma asperellum]